MTLCKYPSPWLLDIACILNSYVVLPVYFKKIEVTGRENIPRTGPLIVAPTHRSRWDALVVPYAVGKLVSGRSPWFMVTANEMKGLQGWVISRLGCFAVDTVRPTADSIKKSKYLLSQGQMLAIFPEGDIYRTEKVNPLKKGIARIALDLEEEIPGIGTKILPVHISYSQKFPKCGTSIKINIGVPLLASEYRENSLKQSSEKLTQTLESSLEGLSLSVNL